MIQRLRFVGVLAALFVAVPAFAQIEIPDGTVIDKSVTWRAADSPFTLMGSLTIGAGAILIIEPGVTVRCDSREPIVVEGSLQAVGTSAIGDSIKFLRSFRNTMGWGGISFVGEGESNLAFVRISDVNAPSTEPLGGAIRVINKFATVNLTDCVLSDNIAYTYGGAIGVNMGSVTMTRCIIARNSTIGKDGCAVNIEAGIVDILNCTLVGNPSGGIRVTGGVEEGAVTLVNTIVWQGKEQVVIAASVKVIANYCIIYGTLPPFVEGVYNRSVDPLFVDLVGGDYNLTASSPCIDMGSTKTPLDPDGTRTDIGARFFDQRTLMVLTLPDMDRWLGDQIALPLVGTISNAYSLQIAVLFDPTVLDPPDNDTILDTLLMSTAFDQTTDPIVRANIVADTLFLAISSSEPVSVTDGLIARFAFDAVGIGDFALAFVPELTRVNEALPILNNGWMTVTPIPYGDVTGDQTVSPLDAARILQYIVRIVANLNHFLADVSGNGETTAYDGALILYQTVNPSYLFPVQGGPLLKPASQPGISWTESDGAWALYSTGGEGPIGADITMRLPESATISSDASLAYSRDGELVTIAVAAFANESELFRVTGVSAVPHIVSARVNDIPAITAVPLVFDLRQNAPNPFNPRTALRFSIPEAGVVQLAIYDVNGRLVRTLVDGNRVAGVHEVTWDGMDDAGRAVASGVYVCRLTNQREAMVRRMTLVR